MRITTLAVIAGLSPACAAPFPSDASYESGIPTAPLAGATVVLSEVINTVAFVGWVPPAAGESWVEYGLDPNHLDFSTPRVATTTDPHEQVVLGLKADHTYHWRAVTEGDGVRYLSELDTVLTGSPPPGIPPVEVTVSDPAKYDPSPWILTVIVGIDDPTTVVIFDREGDPVWYSESPSTVRKMHTARPGWDGRSIVYGYYDQDQDEELGGIYRIGMDGRTLVFSSTVDADHDFVERRDGTFAYLHLDSRDDQLVEGEVADVAANGIYETGEGDDPDVSPPTEIFNQFDDSGQALYWTCSHMIAVNDEVDAFSYHQWTHANSLIPDPDAPDDFYWVNYRFQDSLLRIDRTNQRIDWEIGGLHDDSDLPLEAAFDHGHLSHFWPGGFLMFDNNTHGSANSSVREYAYDPSTKHVSLEHEWIGGAETPSMADARRTDSGTVLINWSGQSMIQERTYDDEVVWQLDITESTAGRITLLRDLYQLDDPYDY